MLLRVATSLDGRHDVDDASPERLILSGRRGLNRVDAERAAADAILVGAATIAADDPRLLVRSAARSAERVTRGLPPSPIKVAITRSGRGLDPSAKFFTTGDGERARLRARRRAGGPRRADIAPAAAPPVPDLQRRLAGLATVVIAPDLPAVLADLAARGVARLMVEGGTPTTTAFLTAGLVDELQVVVAPLVVGDPAAPRLAAAAVDRMELVDLRRLATARCSLQPRLP